MIDADEGETVPSGWIRIVGKGGCELTGSIVTRSDKQKANMITKNIVFLDVLFNLIILQ